MFTYMLKKLVKCAFDFLKCRKGVTAIEYAVIAVALITIIAVVFNPSSGPLYDAVVQAKDSMVAVLADSSGS
ncbi:Flp family type IVb pilin [Marinomonas ostreistagni]|uniref:Flp pilus assembly protein, pilin Flp n=1 Tax=Marinomonas ostreistagni TaxID=359209 RepID=A0ABS0Z9E8_9GAMM|nr:Flp family type IVb pilin [Marinomonas ostreistagni]MBJ7550267.1 hypothetical protein [Marinomonas ostreistagni]